MAVKTSNACGKISISDEAIAKVTSYASLECYGIVEMVSRKLSIADSNFVRMFANL